MGGQDTMSGKRECAVSILDQDKLEFVCLSVNLASFNFFLPNSFQFVGECLQLFSQNSIQISHYFKLASLERGYVFQSQFLKRYLILLIHPRQSECLGSWPPCTRALYLQPTPVSMTIFPMQVARGCTGGAESKFRVNHYNLPEDN